jgi:hypothetical protein
MTKLVPMQKGGDEQQGREQKDTDVRGPDAVPFLPEQNGAEEDDAVDVGRADEHRRHRRRDWPGEKLFRACGKEIQNDEGEKDDEAEKRGDEFGETVDPVGGSRIEDRSVHKIDILGLRLGRQAC